MSYYFWGIREEPPRRPRCDPRLLKQLGVRQEVCEAIHRELDEQGTGH